MSTGKKVSTYLLFDGDCKQALEFYSKVFDADLELQKTGETPMAQQFPREMHEKIIHGTVKGKTIELYASDWMKPEEKAQRGNMNCLFFFGNGKTETGKIFKKLSENAEVTDELQEMPFGLYGRLIDQFGVIWMFQADVK